LGKHLGAGREVEFLRDRPAHQVEEIEQPDPGDSGKNVHQAKRDQKVVMKIYGERNAFHESSVLAENCTGRKWLVASPEMREGVGFDRHEGASGHYMTAGIEI